MVDIILFCFSIGCIYGGFWAGAKYGTLAKAWEAFKGLFKDQG